MNNQNPNTNNKITKKFDLEERTTKLGKAIIIFLKDIPETTITRPIISQLLRSATSIGANYCEADDAESKKDFEHKLGICKKEARETKYWLEMLKTTKPKFSSKIDLLYQEAKELNLIFNAIIIKTKNRII